MISCLVLLMQLKISLKSALFSGGSVELGEPDCSRLRALACPAKHPRKGSHSRAALAESRGTRAVEAGAWRRGPLPLEEPSEMLSENL